MYGHAWVSVQGVTPQKKCDKTGADVLTGAGEVWAMALAGLSGKQLADGLEACFREGAEFPPSAPRFRSMCLGIPTMAAVHADLNNRTPDKQQPFTLLVTRFIPQWAWRTSDSEKELRRLLSHGYEEAKAHVMAGGELPEPVKLIEKQPEPEVIPLAKDEARKRIRGILDEIPDPPPLFVDQDE